MHTLFGVHITFIQKKSCGILVNAAGSQMRGTGFESPFILDYCYQN